MNARSHGSQRASRRPIGREQAPRTIGAVARTVQEAIDTGEAISVGAVSLVKTTALAAFSGAREVGAEAGSAAVAAVRGSIAAAREIGGDLGRMSGRVLHGTFGAEAVRERETSVLRACRVPNPAKRLNVVQRPKTLFEPQRSMTSRS